MIEIPKKDKTYIHVITGDCPGKTTAALGVALRALGHKRRVTVVQFMKGRNDIGIFKAQKLIDNLTVHQFGRPGFVNLRKPSLKDEELANQGLGFVQGILHERFPPHVLILDEINLAADIGLLDPADILEVLRHAKGGMDIFLTGRHAPKALMDIADFVTKVEEVKMPKRWIARKGIEF